MKRFFVLLVFFIILFFTFVKADIILSGNSIFYDNSMSGLEISNVQDAIDELYTRINSCEEETVVKVATNFYNAGVTTFKVMDEGSASATVNASASKTNTKKDSKNGESDHMYLYKNPDNNYGVITSINIPISGSHGGAYQLGSASYSATVSLMTDTGVTLDSYTINSGDNGNKWSKEYTFKPANYEIPDDVEYLYVSWSVSGTASIKPDSNSNNAASFSFTISYVNVDYLPLS